MKLRSSEKGAAVVEFAFLSLLLLIFVFGIIEFGFIWVQSHYVANAAREGARVAAKKEAADDRTTAAKNAVKDSLRVFFMYDDKVDDVDFLAISVSEEDLAMASPLPIPPRLIKVSVTAQSGQIWKPILWPLLNLLPGGDIFPEDYLTSITQSASFVIVK